MFLQRINFASSAASSAAGVVAGLIAGPDDSAPANNNATNITPIAAASGQMSPNPDLPNFLDQK